MSILERYPNASAFRRALEHRLRIEAQKCAIPLNRLRKDAAFNRLLTRFEFVAKDVWALKGGFALIARVGTQVRGTKDIDTNWRATRADLENFLLEVESSSLADWFDFRIGDARVLKGEGEAGALRYPVSAYLDGRIFEQLTLDINIVGPLDPRPIELVAIRHNPFEFVDVPPLHVPMITPAQQLSEKLHAYMRWYADEPSSRAKDLFDMLIIADQVQVPHGSVLKNSLQQTFKIRSTPLPVELLPPPADWSSQWAVFLTDYPVRWLDLASAFYAVQKFWLPILATDGHSDSRWNPVSWEWERPQ